MVEIPPPEINWGYNCLTPGIHHGRPELLWNLPILQAVEMFTPENLKAIVLGRIHTDALIMVNRLESKGEWMTEEWAQRLRDHAEDRYVPYLESKLDEIRTYYKSASYERNQVDMVVRVLDNRLNPHYNPLHAHDSLNMLCRILGLSAWRAAG